jgi:hypothetical protein
MFCERGGDCGDNWRLACRVNMWYSGGRQAGAGCGGRGSPAVGVVGGEGNRVDYVSGHRGNGGAEYGKAGAKRGGAMGGGGGG